MITSFNDDYDDVILDMLYIFGRYLANQGQKRIFSILVSLKQLFFLVQQL